MMYRKRFRHFRLSIFTVRRHPRPPTAIIYLWSLVRVSRKSFWTGLFKACRTSERFRILRGKRWMVKFDWRCCFEHRRHRLTFRRGNIETSSSGQHVSYNGKMSWLEAVSFRKLDATLGLICFADKFGRDRSRRERGGWIKYKVIFRIILIILRSVPFLKSIGRERTFHEL